MRVLLVSPRTRSDRYSGEDAYTDSLMAAPPEGIEYVHHDDLIASGRGKRARWVQRLTPRLSRLLGGPLWIESVVSDESFDRIHVHGFSCFLGGKLARTPVILSESSLDLENLVDYYAWTPARMRRFAVRKRLALRATGIYDQTLNLRDARHLSLWSDWARRLHRTWGVPDNLMGVIPPPVEDIEDVAVATPEAGPHFLFVGAEFQRKNGPAVLEAFHQVRRSAPTARLTIVGERNADIGDPANGVTHFRHLPRERIRRELYPSASVFVMPSRAEGYGITVVEAMSAGIPCVVSDYGALPEIVGDTGRVVPLPATSDALADAMRDLMKNGDRQATRARYERGWSRAVTMGALADLYRK